MKFHIKADHVLHWPLEMMNNYREVVLKNRKTVDAFGDAGNDKCYEEIKLANQKEVWTKLLNQTQIWSARLK